MSYKDRFGITDIKSDPFHNLSISWEPVDKESKIPVLLFSPSMNDSANHYHIEMTKEEAKILKEWLTLYLEDLDVSE